MANGSYSEAPTKRNRAGTPHFLIVNRVIILSTHSLIQNCSLKYIHDRFVDNFLNPGALTFVFTHVSFTFE